MGKKKKQEINLQDVYSGNGAEEISGAQTDAVEEAAAKPEAPVTAAAALANFTAEKEAAKADAALEETPEETTAKKGKKKRAKKEKPPKPPKPSKEQLKSYHKRRLKNNLRVLPFLIPSLAGVILFYLAPFAVVIFYAFVDNPITKNFVGFQNIVNVFKNASFQEASLNTLRFSVIAVPSALVIALLLAIMLDHKIPLASEFRTSYLSPMVVPVASVVLVFQVLFDFNGVASEMVQFFGGEKIDWMKSNWGPVVVLILFLWKNLGYNMILFLGALGNIPKDALEVAYLDTNSSWTIFWKIKIHYLSPTLLFVTIISLINSFKTFREVYLLTGSYPFHTMYILQHYMNNMFDSMDYQKLSSAAILMSIVMTAIILGLYIAENRFGRDMEE